MTLIFLFLLSIGCYYSLTRDTGMLVFLVLIGFLQDPVRKVIAGEPIYFTITVGVIAGCAFLRQLALNKSSITDPYFRWNDQLFAPMLIFALILGVQFVHALLRYGAPIVPVLGLIFYTAPLIAISVGYAQFPDFQNIRRLLVLHTAFALLVSITVLLSFSGFQSELFGEVGVGLKIYDQGTVLKAHSGLMRSSEIAGWHMGAAACFLLIMLAHKNSMPRVIVTGILVILLLTAIVLTGRRKMIFQFLMFGVLYFPFLRLYQKRLATGYFVTATLVAGVVYLVALMAFPLVANSQFELYLMRGSTVFGDATDRFSSLGLGSVGWAIDRFGLLGGGLGVAAQGAQHFTGNLSGGVGEGGLGKIVAELGAFSLIIVGWLIFVIATHVHRCLSLISRYSPRYLPFAVGIGVFVASNVPTFVVASQVYGDVFVLLILGLMVGFLFAIPRLVISELYTKKSPQPVTPVLNS